MPIINCNKILLPCNSFIRLFPCRLCKIAMSFVIVSEMLIQGLSSIPHWNQTILDLFHNVTMDNSEMLIQRHSILISSLLQHINGSSFYENYFARYLQMNEMFVNQTNDNEYGFYVPYSIDSFCSPRINRNYFLNRCNCAFGMRQLYEVLFGHFFCAQLLWIG